MSSRRGHETAWLAPDARLGPAQTDERQPVAVDPNLLDDLEWRGLLAHSTDLDALREALAEGPVRFYVGFDPTAPSLHMGNLVQIVTAHAPAACRARPLPARRRRDRA